MADKLLLFIFLYIGSGTLAQHSTYSLQDAVEALRRREAQLALRDNFNETPPSYFNPPPPEDEEYWSQDPVASPSIHINRHQLNKLLARYLTREEEDRDGENGFGVYEPDFDEDNNYIQDERKRSFFRERGGKYEPTYASVFRERELAPYETPELAEEFLREIEEEKDLVRELKYKEALQKLWEKYEQQENEIKEDLFDEDSKRKRQLLPYLSPVRENKRSYPVLPWLPASRKKRFPVTKRSPRASNEASIGASGTEEKVARDLEAIFNEPSDEKKKRSTRNEPSTTPESQQNTNKENKPPSSNSHSGGQSHDHHSSHDGQDRDESDSEEQDHEREHEHDHAHDHDHEEDEEDDHDFDDEEEEDRKKKREISAKKRSTQEIVREDQIIPGDLSNFKKKKAVDWSQYFGMDRRKKSEDWFMRNNNEAKKRSTGKNNEKRINKNTDQDKLDKKLKTIEDLIVDETVKYTGAHEGISDPEEIRQLKDHVVSRLATAYSLEKMRRALDKLKQSVDNENHLQRNEIEGDSKIDENDKEKRVAVKKEKVEFDNNQHSVETQSAEQVHKLPSNEVEENDDDKKKKKKKRNGGSGHHYTQFDLGDFEDELGAGHFEPLLNEGYLGNRNNYNYLEGSQCPILDTMADRCRGVDLLSGDIHQELLAICGVHQLCYLCGTSQTACDFQYLSEADSICGRNNDCLSAARAALMILRGTPGQQLGPKECMKNHCLYRAMKEIGL